MKINTLIVFSANIKGAVPGKEGGKRSAGEQKSTKAVGPCSNWQSSAALIPNLSLMNISLGAHQGE